MTSTKNNSKYEAVEIRGRFNCQGCNMRGNVCRDSDGVYRCSSCSYAAWRQRTPHPAHDVVPAANHPPS